MFSSRQFCAFSTIIISQLLLAGCTKHEGTSNSVPTSPKVDAPKATVPDSKEPAFKGTAEELTQVGQKYEGKLVEVVGFVEFAPEGDDLITFTLKGKGDGSRVKCKLSPGPEVAKTVRELGQGQKVTVTGSVSSAGGDRVELKDCSCKVESPNPAVRISAKDLGKEFTSDGESASKKYQGKELVVEGTVLDVAKPMDDRVAVKLDAGLSGPMSCEAHNEAVMAEFLKLKKGDKVVLKGQFFDDSNQAFKHHPSLFNSSLVKKQ